MKKWKLFLLAAIYAINGTAQPSLPETPKAPELSGFDSLGTQQLMVVLTQGWDSLAGKLYCFDRIHGQWLLRFGNAVVVGKKGLGLGVGILPLVLEGAPQKKEGDLKAPAGFFGIGTAFGYAPASEARWIKNRYIPATDTVICVDDSHSSHYNTLIDRSSASIDYSSYEEMHRKDDAYKWGLFINHNSHPAEAWKGSCIFMHIWEGPSSGTVGCTAMEEKNLLRVLHWIDSSKKPLLVQLPVKAYHQIQSDYHLPALP